MRPYRVSWLALALCVLALGCISAAAPADTVAFSNSVTFRFAGLQESQSFLGAGDAFTESLTDADRELRFGDAHADYRQRAAAEARAWEAGNIALVREAIALTRARFAAAQVALPLPREVLLIKTTGAEEGGAGNYTRSNAIIFTAAQMQRTPQELVGVLSHELFHVATRAHPALRDQLYPIIGFHPCTARYPSELLARKITNPDAHTYVHCISVEAGGATRLVTPITLMGERRPGQQSMFDAIEVQLLDAGDGHIYAIDDVHGYFEQIGRNTDYVIHPEEIMADNFSMMVRGVANVPNPEILSQIQSALHTDGGG